MKAQSLDWRASSSRAARSAASRQRTRAERPEQPELAAPGGPDQVRHRRRIPGLEALSLPPAPLGGRPLLGLVLAQCLRQGEQADPVEHGAPQHLPEPDRSLGPPVAEQLRVDREDAETAAATLGAVALQPVADRARNDAACSAARLAATAGS